MGGSLEEGVRNANRPGLVVAAEDEE